MQSLKRTIILSLVGILFSIIWIIHPISYDEMRSRHPIYSQENVVVVNSPSISNQGFNLLENNDRKVSLNTSLTNKKSNFSEEEVKALGMNNETILVKGVDGYTVTPNYAGRRSSPGRTPSSPSHGSKPPRVPSGFYRMPHKPVEKQGIYGGPTSLGGSSGSDSGSGSPGDDSINKKSSNQSQDPSYYHQSKKKKKKNSQQVSEKRVIEAYQNFISQMSDKGYEVNISEDRFLELSRNPQTGKFDEKSIFEAEGGLEAEVLGLFKNLRRPENPDVDLDFQAELVDSGKTIFVDHKGMIDFGSLSDIGVDISGFPSHENVAFNMGNDSVEQKGRFVGVDQGPTSRSDVVHLYNFTNRRNTAEIPLLMQAVLNGAEQAGYTDGIIFLNYK
jgi:hypothetical protein